MSDSRSLHIGIAVALGMFMGLVVAFNAAPALWWLGLILGGGSAYLLYEPRSVASAVARAWRKTISWSPDWTFWKEFSKSVLVSLAYFQWISMLCFMDYFEPRGIEENVTLVLAFLMISILGVFGVAFSVVCLIIGAIDHFSEQMHPIQKVTRFGAIYLNILTFPIGLAKLCAMIPIPSKSAIGGVFRSIGRCFMTVIREIHCQERTLCMLDAATGVAIRYFAGPASLFEIALWAMVGGLVSVLHYEIVSKRVLKVVPVRVTSNKS